MFNNFVEKVLFVPSVSANLINIGISYLKFGHEYFQNEHKFVNQFPFKIYVCNVDNPFKVWRGLMREV